MNIADTIEMLSDFPAELTPCIRGVHGCGKTEVIRMISTTIWGMRCVELQGSQLSDVGDLIGLQKIIEFEEDEEQVVIDETTGEQKTVTVKVKRQETRWVPPYWFPKDGKPITLFLDELNRAAPPIKRAMMQIGNDHRILNFSLPEGSRVIVACNPDNEGDYDVEEFDDAENDRYWHMEFTPAYSEWESHMRKLGALEWIITYFAKHQKDLDPYAVAEDGKLDRKANNTNASGIIEPAKPSRRSATRFDKVCRQKLAKNPYCFSGPHGLAMLQMLAAGYFGGAIAKKIKDWYMQNGQGLKPAEFIVGDWKKNKAEIEKMAKSVLQINSFAKGIVVEMDRLEKAGELTTNGKANDLCVKVADNWYNFLKAVPPEAAARINAVSVEEARKNSEAWVPLISHTNTKVRDLYLEMADMDV